MKNNTNQGREGMPRLPVLFFKLVKGVLPVTMVMLLFPGILLLSSIFFGRPTLISTPADPKPALLLIAAISGAMLLLPSLILLGVAQNPEGRTKGEWNKDYFALGLMAMPATVIVALTLTHAWLLDTGTKADTPLWLVQYLSFSWVLMVFYVLMLIVIAIFLHYRNWSMLHENG